MVLEFEYMSLKVHALSDHNTSPVNDCSVHCLRLSFIPRDFILFLLNPNLNFQMRLPQTALCFPPLTTSTLDHFFSVVFTLKSITKDVKSIESEIMSRIFFQVFFLI